MKTSDQPPVDGTAALQYHDAASAALQKLKASQLTQIIAASKICADSIAQGGLVFLFGSGHSRMMVDEMTPRQGCFVGFYPLVELSVSNYSRIIGPNGLRARSILKVRRLRRRDPERVSLRPARRVHRHLHQWDPSSRRQERPWERSAASFR
jgi:hypothetical protein